MLRKIIELMDIKKTKERYRFGRSFFTDPSVIRVMEKSAREIQKTPKRFDVINFLLSRFPDETDYLEIGVRKPADNFDRIQASNKWSVDPGVEFKSNPVDFQITSDEFFDGLKAGTLENVVAEFDVIFIDGLHLAEQVYRDIQNALAVLKPNGFIVLHDCNPPTEYHSREDYYFEFSPAKMLWNGSTWKGYYAARRNLAITGTCINSDWGVGVLSKKDIFTPLKGDGNPFFEYRIMADNREELLNLTSFDDFKALVEKAT